MLRIELQKIITRPGRLKAQAKVKTRPGRLKTKPARSQAQAALLVILTLLVPLTWQVWVQPARSGFDFCFDFEGDCVTSVNH